MAVLKSGRVLMAAQAVVIALAASASGLCGQSLTQAEALALAFPGAKLERRTAYLSATELDAAARIAGPDVAVESGIVTYYLALEGATPVGVAYFDAHPVRTLPEVLMIVVGREGRIERIETVSFHEPPEYRAPGGWLRQFEGKGIGEELSPKRGLPNLTGASLTAAAVARAARRTLALHAIIDPFGGASP